MILEWNFLSLSLITQPPKKSSLRPAGSDPVWLECLPRETDVI